MYKYIYIYYFYFLFTYFTEKLLLYPEMSVDLNKFNKILVMSIVD